MQWVCHRQSFGAFGKLKTDDIFREWFGQEKRQKTRPPWRFAAMDPTWRFAHEQKGLPKLNP